MPLILFWKASNQKQIIWWVRAATKIVGTPCPYLGHWEICWNDGRKKNVYPSFAGKWAWDKNKSRATGPQTAKRVPKRNGIYNTAARQVSILVMLCYKKSHATDVTAMANDVLMLAEYRIFHDELRLGSALPKQLSISGQDNLCAWKVLWQKTISLPIYIKLHRWQQGLTQLCAITKNALQKFVVFFFPD